MADSGRPRGVGDPVLIAWKCVRFGELAPRELHDILQARSAVFVVEQACAFQDVDGADPQCWHLMGHASVGGALLAYARLVSPGVKFDEPSIGRVLTTAEARLAGVGRELMREALARAEALWPGKAIRIGAQRRLERFYRDFGFVPSSEPYDEDGIVHVEMLRAGQ